MSKAKVFEITVNGVNFSKKVFRDAFNNSKAGEYSVRSNYTTKVNQINEESVNQSKKMIREIKLDYLSGQLLNKKSGNTREGMKIKNKSSRNKSTTTIYNDNRLTDIRESGKVGFITVKAHTENRDKVFRKTVKPYLKNVKQHRRKVNIEGLWFMKKESERSQVKIIEMINKIIMKDL